MKKTFQIIGLISLTCFSFFVTEKTATVVNNMDEIMVEIKEKMNNYKSDAIDAIIEGNTIIPGISSKKVNIGKSYKNMKDSGYFNDKLFIYDYTKPNISIENNKDKYIIKGNPSKRMVSFVFTLNGNDNIDDILNILNNYKIKATFFVDYMWYESNNTKIKEMTNLGHLISPLMEDYTDSDFEWMDMVIKKVNKQAVNFCYSKEDDKENLDICALKGNYTIRPIVISERTPLVDIKNKLESGSLLSLTNNSELKKELSSIIIYIKSKGYNIANLDEHILE